MLRASAREPSVEPSSTRISSQSYRVCAKTDRMASASVFWLLKNGNPIETCIILTPNAARSNRSPPAWRHMPGYRSGCQRSEEHTSELQSLRHLVCRLLLEKKH